MVAGETAPAAVFVPTLKTKTADRAELKLQKSTAKFLSDRQ